MKLKVLKSNLMTGFKKVQGTIPGKPPMAILANVKLEAEGRTLSLTTSNLDMTVHAMMECEVIEGGATTVPGKLIISIVGALPEGVVELDIGEGEGTMAVSGGDSIFRIPCMDAKDFPTPPSVDGGRQYVMSANALKEIIRKTEFAQCADATRSTLMGTLFDFSDGQLTAVATDGRRLAKVSLNIGESDIQGKFVIPAYSIAEISKVLSSDGDVVIKTAQTQMAFSIEQEKVTVFTKILDVIYPNYNQVIPAAFSNQVKVDRTALATAVMRCSLMGDESAGRHVKFTIGDNQLVVTATNEAIGGEARDIVPVKYAGPTLSAMFDPKFILEPLKAIDSDEIILSMNGAAEPKAITIEGMPVMNIIMPIRQA